MPFDLNFYFKVFLSRFPLFLVVFILVILGGVYLALTLPKIYRAEAHLLVETSQIPTDLAASTVRTELSDQVQIIQQKLMTRDNLLDLAYRFDLFEDEPDLQPQQIVARMQERVRMGLSMGRQQATIFSITAEANDGQTAADLVNALVDQVLEQDAAFRTEVASDTLDFFEKEVERLSQELDLANQRILEFQNNNVDALPETLEYRMSRQTLLQERLSQARREIGQLTEQRRRLVDLYETTGRAETAVQRSLSPEEAELKQLQAELRAALAVFSESNPKVIVLRDRIAKLENMIAGRDPGAEPEDPGASLFEAQIAELDSQIASLSEAATELETQVAAVQETIERTPTNSITLNALERDRESIQGQYDKAVDRLSAAATGERIEVLSKGQRLSVIERAVVPVTPAEPNLLLIGAATAAGAVLLGAAAVVLRELANPRIRRPVEITRKLGITPLGTLPFVEAPGELWRRRAMHGLTLALIVACIAAALLVIDRRVTPLGPLAQKVLSEGRL